MFLICLSGSTLLLGMLIYLCATTNAKSCVSKEEGIWIRRKVLKLVSLNNRPPYTWNGRVLIYAFADPEQYGYEVISDKLHGKTLKHYCSNCHPIF